MHKIRQFHAYSKYYPKDNVKNFTTIGNTHTTNLKNASECSVTNSGLTRIVLIGFYCTDRIIASDKRGQSLQLSADAQSPAHN